MEKIKKIFLIIFVFAGVILIALVWIQGITVNTTSTISSSTATESYYVVFTVTPTPQLSTATVQPESEQPTKPVATVFPSATPNPVNSADATATFFQMGIDE